MVKMAVRGAEWPIGGSRSQLEGLRGKLEDLGVSQRIWEASKGVWRVKLAGGGAEKRRKVETKSQISPAWYHRLSTPSRSYSWPTQLRPLFSDTVPIQFGNYLIQYYSLCH